MTARTAVVASVLIVLAVLLVAAATTRLPSPTCAPLLSVTQSARMINTLDAMAPRLASSTQQLALPSSEGATQTRYQQAQATLIVEQRFYGETGRSYLRLYYDNQKPFALVKIDTHYQAPIYNDATPLIKTEELRTYLLANDGRVCDWAINEKPQPIDQETVEMVASWLAGIQPLEP